MTQVLIVVLNRPQGQSSYYQITQIFCTNDDPDTIYVWNQSGHSFTIKSQYNYHKIQIVPLSWCFILP